MQTSAYVNVLVKKQEKWILGGSGKNNTALHKNKP